MINNEVIKDENAAKKRESLSKRIEQLSNPDNKRIGNIIAAFAAQPLKSIMVGKNGKFDKEFLDAIPEEFNIQGYDYDCIAFVEFLAIFEHYLYYIKNDEDYGFYEEDSPYLPVYLPVYLLMGYIRNSIQVNPAARRFFSINFNKFSNYIASKHVCKHICIDIMNLRIPGYIQKPGDTIGDMLGHCLDTCIKYWTPGEDVGVYILKMKAAYDVLYRGIYCPIMCALFKQTDLFCRDT